MVLAQSPVWHFWFAVVIMIGAVAPALIGIVVLYLNKVVRPKYPKHDQERA